LKATNFKQRYKKIDKKYCANFYGFAHHLRFMIRGP